MAASQMTKHAEFRRKLSAILPENCRPFVCQGSPYDCKIFVVGLNPATVMENGFWRYWSDCSGFDKVSWFEAYRNERKSRPPRPGKRRRLSVGTTRRNLNKLADLVGAYVILETNIYSVPTEHYTDLQVEEKVTEVFHFLLTEIKPTLIITHGKDSADYFSREVQEFGNFAIETVAIQGNSHEIISVPHLSRGWSSQKLEEFADFINNDTGTARGSVSAQTRTQLNEEPGGSKMHDVPGLRRLFGIRPREWSSRIPIAAIQRSKANVDPNISIEFRWDDAETPKERSRCIRGAFHRISEDSLKQGRCSNHFRLDLSSRIWLVPKEGRVPIVGGLCFSHSKKTIY